MDRVHHDLSTEWHNWLKRHGITQFYLFRRCETRQDQDLLFQTYLLLLHPECSTVLHTGLLLDLRTEPASSHLGVFACDALFTLHGGPPPAPSTLSYGSGPQKPFLLTCPPSSQQLGSLNLYISKNKKGGKTGGKERRKISFSISQLSCGK